MTLDPAEVGIILGTAIATGAGVWAKMRFTRPRIQRGPIAFEEYATRSDCDAQRIEIRDDLNGIKSRLGNLEGRFAGMDERLTDMKHDIRTLVEISTKQSRRS